MACSVANADFIPTRLLSLFTLHGVTKSRHTSLILHNVPSPAAPLFLLVFYRTAPKFSTPHNTMRLHECSVAFFRRPHQSSSTCNCRLRFCRSPFPLCTAVPTAPTDVHQHPNSNPIPGDPAGAEWMPPTDSWSFQIPCNVYKLNNIGSLPTRRMSVGSTNLLHVARK
jgi:hypothetical protein